MNNATITLHNLTKKFDGTIIINSISHTFHQSHSYVIQGPSGIGKSTLLSLIAGFESPSTGNVTCNNQPLAIQKNRISFLFQRPRLIEELTVYENSVIAGHLYGLSTAEASDKAHTLLTAVGLSHKEKNMPSTLSGGELQRVALVRSLMIQPTFLIADEPTANLDYETTTTILALIHAFQNKYGMGIIMTTHDDRVAAKFNHRYTLVNGILSEKE